MAATVQTWTQAVSAPASPSPRDTHAIYGPPIGVPPVVTIVTPPALANDPIILDITSLTDLGIQHGETTPPSIAILYDGGATFDPVLDNAMPGPTPLYSVSAIMLVANGFRASIQRLLPWTKNPALSIVVTDAQGLKNSANQFGPWTISDLAVDGPVISSPTPNPGLISAIAPLGFTVADATNPSLTFAIAVKYPGGSIEPVTDPATGGLTDLFIGSTIPSGPGVASIVRSRPWPLSPALSIWVVDGDGHTASTSYAWLIATPAPPVARLVPTVSPAAPGGSPRGTDISTQVDSGDGPDLDPLFRIMTNPRDVIGQRILRLWETPRGGYPGDAGIGWNVLQLLNAALTQNQIFTAQTAMSNAATGDQEVQSCGVQITPPTSSQPITLITALITPKLATGVRPFTLTCSVDGLTIKLITLSPSPASS